MNLVDLRYRLSGPTESGIHGLYFLCPKCQKHEVFVRIWGNEAGEIPTAVINGETLHERIWHFESDHAPGWSERLTISPSLDFTPQKWPCGGWHGMITNGEAKP
jgi:hypothetical protein